MEANVHIHREEPMFQPDSDEVIEATRLDRLTALRRSQGTTLPADASHSASTLMKAVDDQLAGHPAVAANPELYRLAYRAFEALFTLNQTLGNEPVLPPAPTSRARALAS